MAQGSAWGMGIRWVGVVGGAAIASTLGHGLALALDPSTTPSASPPAVLPEAAPDIALGFHQDQKLEYSLGGLERSEPQQQYPLQYPLSGSVGTAPNLSMPHLVPDNSKLDAPPETKPDHTLGDAPRPTLGSPPPPLANTAVDIDPAILDSSPVLRRWLEDIPDIAGDIRQDPAFRPRLRLGYAHFPSNDHTGGLYVAAQDVLIGNTPLALSGDYGRNGRGDRVSYGAEVQYYLLPLGSYFNLAPVVGYRSLQTSAYTVDGVNVGLRLVLVPSRTGAADLSLTQTWVLPSGGGGTIGLTTLSAGYAITSQLRLSTDIQVQNAPSRQDSRVGVLVEWML